MAQRVLRRTIVCLLIWMCLVNVTDNVKVSIPLYLSNSASISLATNTYDDRGESFEPNLHGRPGQGYYINVNVGTPRQNLNVLVDTGSSNFAVASVYNPLIDKYFHVENSSSFQRRNVNVDVPYTMGHWEGCLGSDVVQLLDLPPVRSDIALITSAENFFINKSDWQGILGLAYPSIARPVNKIKPFFDELVSSGVTRNVFSLQLCGEQGTNEASGSLILGGIDPTLHRDQIRYTPLRHEWYYDIVLTSVAVGNDYLAVDCKQLNNDKAIIDSGTTNMRFPQQVFDALVESLHRQIEINESIPSEFWTGVAVICWREGKPLEGFPEIRLSLLHTSNSTFNLVISPQQYLRLVIDPENYVNRTCFKFAISSSDKGTVVGAVVMEGFYIVFDRENKQIGFAKSSCLPYGSSSFGAEIEGPFPHSDPWACAYQHTVTSTEIISYVAMALALLCTIPLIILVLHWSREKWLHWCRKKTSDDDQLITN